MLLYITFATLLQMQECLINFHWFPFVYIFQPTSNQWQTLWNLYQPYYASGTYPTYPASSYYRGEKK